MEYFKEHNRFVVTIAIFGVCGLVLLGGVMIFHLHINRCLTAAEANAQIPAVSVQAESTTNPLPDSVVREIVNDERNLIGSTQLPKSLSPALKFLRTISDPDIFLTQK
ncbi:hypothetical protein A2V68_00250 [candidate division Kazan bacterium RBG_13_50_9]|uniref:Uncharacterized protein n=1 Tax=candidate division Kazan bacterium RBG_13_50_9 TaxID=1798535 RepID=A0A1F4NS10_UNCK3|nr:MAG: hypothetical protein A2V68_00250 [candidate division Kazan bacterium RBG_13_50_9]